MKWKSIAGAVLIILSVAAMYIWETKGREKVLFVPAAVAAAKIEAGEPISSDKFIVIKTLPESMPDGALSMEEISAMQGVKAAHAIGKGEMVIKSDFVEERDYVPEGMSVFVIPLSWIYSRSSSLRAGDKICIYTMPDKVLLGSYRAAYVRDSADQEVVDVAGEGHLYGPASPSSVITSVEIMCSTEDYFNIFDAVAAAGPGCLLLSEEAVL